MSVKETERKNANPVLRHEFVQGQETMMVLLEALLLSCHFLTQAVQILLCCEDKGQTHRQTARKENVKEHANRKKSEAERQKR